MLQQVETLHNLAMECKDKALVYKLNGDIENYNFNLTKAYENELNAAMMLKDHDVEPSRAILFQSAACLAMEVKNYKEAEKLIFMGLSGNPPVWVSEELKNLFEEINFERHLKLKGITLDEYEFQMSMTGNSVGYGICSSDEYLSRINTVSLLLQRSAQRKISKDGHVTQIPSDIKKIFSPFISEPRAASFAVTFRIGKPDEQLELFREVDKKAIIDDVFQCMTLFQEKKMTELKNYIGPTEFYNNFIGLAGKLAPDGKRIKSVGFTRLVNSEEKTMLISEPLQERLISSAYIYDNQSEFQNIQIGDELSISGILLLADKRKEKLPKIQIRNNDGDFTIRIPEGIIDDIVRPLWDKKVLLKGVKRTKKLIDYLSIEEEL